MEDDTNFERIDSLGFITKTSPSRLRAHLEMLRVELGSDNGQARNRATRILLDPAGDLVLSDVKLILSHSDPGVQSLGFILLDGSVFSEHWSELMEELLYCMRAADHSIRDKAGKALFRALDDADIPVVSAAIMKAIRPRAGEYWPVQFIERIRRQNPDLDVTPFIEAWAVQIWDNRNTVINSVTTEVMGVWADNSPERTRQLFRAIDAACPPDGASHFVDSLRGRLLEDRKEEAAYALTLATGGRGKRLVEASYMLTQQYGEQRDVVRLTPLLHHRWEEVRIDAIRAAVGFGLAPYFDAAIAGLNWRHCSAEFDRVLRSGLGLNTPSSVPAGRSLEDPRLERYADRIVELVSGKVKLQSNYGIRLLADVLAHTDQNMQPAVSAIIEFFTNSLRHRGTPVPFFTDNPSYSPNIVREVADLLVGIASQSRVGQTHVAAELEGTLRREAESKNPRRVAYVSEVLLRVEAKQIQ